MRRLSMLVAVLAVLVLAAGCALPVAAPSNGQPSGPGSTSGAGFGAIQVRVTDAPKYGVESVVVHFSQVSVHRAGEGEDEEEATPTPTPTATATPTPTATPTATPTPSAPAEGGWIDIPVEDGSFDLVELGKEGVEALLAQDDLVPAGKYTQIRVIIDEDTPVEVTYSDPDNLDEDGDPVLTTVDAKLPSGELKFVRPFEVVDGTTTIITLDFVVEDSVVFTGASGKDGGVKVILKPVVKLSVERETLLGTISGTVTDSGSDEPIEGATVVVEGTTLTATTDAEGHYTIANVPVGAGTATYTVTASAEGYLSASEEDVEVSAGTTATVDFELAPGPSPSPSPSP